MPNKAMNMFEALSRSASSTNTSKLQSRSSTYNEKLDKQAKKSPLASGQQTPVAIDSASASPSPVEEPKLRWAAGTLSPIRRSGSGEVSPGNQTPGSVLDYEAESAIVDDDAASQFSSFEKPRFPRQARTFDVRTSSQQMRELRRRSRSVESLQHLQQASADSSWVPASGMQGMGTKSRRLSTALPQSFSVDSCPLDKEYKSLHVIRRRKEKLIGEGGYAMVILMRKRRKNGKPIHHDEDLVAVKQFRGPEKDEPIEDYLNKLKSEYAIGNACDHPNIVKCMRLCHNNNNWSQVMEFCDGGSLYDVIENGTLAKDDNYPRCLFIQLLRGVEYLHNHGIAHRDIKPENLLLTSAGTLKIIDFGLSEVFSGLHPGLPGGGRCGIGMGEEIRMSSPALYGSEPYKSPEVEAAKDHFDPRALDVWSCAIVLLVSTFGVIPWERASTEKVPFVRYKNAWDQWLETHPDGIIAQGTADYPHCGKIFTMLHSGTIERLVLRMLHPTPSKRLTASEALQSDAVQAWLDEGACCQKDAYNIMKPGAKLTPARNRAPPKHGHCLPREEQHVSPLDRIGRLLHRESPN